MKIILEISAINYDQEKERLTNALDELQNLFKISGGYELSNPVSRFGWTFFKVWLRPNLLVCINEKFADMIKKSKGQKSEEKFSRFMSDFFESRGCNIKLKLVEET
jgi:hypothetical protein